MITHEELQIILEAKKQEKKYVDVEIQTSNGLWIASFCGKCGRIIHSPDCPEWKIQSSLE